MSTLSEIDCVGRLDTIKYLKKKPFTFMYSRLVPIVFIRIDDGSQE